MAGSRLSSFLSSFLSSDVRGGVGRQLACGFKTSSGGRSSGARVVVGGADADLDSRLSSELDAYNAAASGVDDQREFTVRAEDGDGQLLAGLSGWTWGTCAGVAMVWVRADRRGSGVKVLV